jgi:AcrR family transcriptional regulator
MSPRTPQQFGEIREEKKTLIMDVALEHFSDVGFQATTINHIARHAGISKGLMYNYYKSKEELLAAIMNRSLSEIYLNFNPDRDSYLSTEDFELFIRKIFNLLRENRQFWKLLFRIMLQRGVYEKIFDKKSDSINISGIPLKEFSENMMLLMTDYFRRKQSTSGPEYDPVVEMLMFSNTVKGFALTFIFSSEVYPEGYFEKMIDALIKKYR